MFSIGEFSKITGLTIKTLRFYHEQGILVPAKVDAGSGYRYYDQRNLETARAIAALRAFEFSLDEISEILRDQAEEADMVRFLQRKKEQLSDRIARYRELVSGLDRFLESEAQAKQQAQHEPFEIQEKTVPAMLIAGIRMQGRYETCGQGFARLGRNLGRHIGGIPLCLHYDDEYREDDATFEPCMPIRKAVKVDGIDVRELEGGFCVSLIHQGPYDQLGRSYERIIAYARERGLRLLLPSREIYVKGPGMIFKGNPKKYLTEIQILCEQDS